MQEGLLANKSISTTNARIEVKGELIQFNK